MPPDAGESQIAPDTNTTPDEPKGQPDISQTVNAAVSSHLKRFAEKQLPAMLESVTKPLLEQIAALKAAPPAADDTADRKKASPEVAALTQQLADMQSRLTREAEQRVNAEKRARDDRAFSDFRSELSKQVRPDMLDMVASHLFHTQKLVEVGEDGTATFKGSQTNFGITEEVAYPLKDGVAQWLKSEAAKPYIPAPGTSGAPTIRRQVVSPSGLPANFDLKNATPAQKLLHAEEMEKKFAEALRSRGVATD